MSRTLCEACSHPQPVDWKPGDLCTECGQAVRREVRCFWCARWTPAGKFCRRCGAAVLDDSLYGAARMLRDAGADRFRIPQLIVELDPDQIDNFTRIYQRHAAILNRHVDHVRFLESFLYQHIWSAALEEELTIELPWPEERLEKLSAAMGPEIRPSAGGRDGTDLATTQAIQAATPFADTRCLAMIVRLLLDDWSAQREATNLLSAGNVPLRSEAALALSGWRVIYGPGIQYGYRELLQALRDCPLRLPAAVRLALLGESELPAESLASDDPNLRFMAALASGHQDTLLAALQHEDKLRRSAAATRLIAMDIFSPLGDVILRASPESQAGLIRAMERRSKPMPPLLRETLYEVANRAVTTEVRGSAVRVLCWGCPPGEAERMAEAAGGDSSSYQSILQRAGLPPESLLRLGAWFLEHGVFRMGQFGMRDIAKQGRMPADFVPRNWDRADDRARKELCGFAECQLEEYADEPLHRFLVRVAFGTDSVSVRATVWTALYRWYGHLDASRKSPIRIQMASIERFFGSVPAFLSTYTRFLQDQSLPDLLREAVLASPVLGLIRYPDEDVLPAFAAQAAAVSRLADAIGDMAAAPSRFEFILRTECIGFLAWLAKVPELQKKMWARIAAFQGTDLDHACNQALKRL